MSLDFFRFADVFRAGSWLTDSRTRIYAALAAMISLAGLIWNWTGGDLLLDRFHRPIGTDFAGMWSAGRMLLEGQPYALFDPEPHFAYQRATFGSAEVYGWHYPPFFLAIAALLGALPYIPALILWQASSFAFYLAAMRAIASRLKTASVLVAAAGFPAVFVTLGHGHNAFLTAGLLGFGLLFLDRRPIVAGVLLGLLAYKPQFALVLPAILVGGAWSTRWRTIASATATLLAMTAAVTLWLGPGVWTAFIDGASFTRTVILEQGVTGWHKIQSTFSALRSFGASVETAYAAQAAVTLAVVATLALAAHRKADPRLIAAMTATGALLATPYCLDYDMTILGVAIAFAARTAWRKASLRGKKRFWRSRGRHRCSHASP